jgi:hypothetical protein
VPGPVRQVGARGVAIGRWPDTNRYVFQGAIGELQLWRFDPAGTVRQLLDCCCDRDRRPVEAVLAGLRERGIGADGALDVADQVMAALLDLRAAVGEADAGAGQELDDLLAAARLALLRGDHARLAAMRRRARELTDATLGAATRAAVEQDLADLAAGVGLGPAERAVLRRAYCLDDLVPADPPPDRGPWPVLEDAPWNRLTLPEPLIPPDR